MIAHAEKGLDHIAESVLSYLDAESLTSAEVVCKEWLRVISEGMLWKKLIERKVRTDTLWHGLAERREWIQYLFKPRPGIAHPSHNFYRSLFPKIIKVSVHITIHTSSLTGSEDLKNAEIYSIRVNLYPLSQSIGTVCLFVRVKTVQI